MADNWFKQHKVWSVIIVLVVIGAIGSLFGLGDDEIVEEENTDSNEEIIEQEPVLNEFGEEYEIDELSACYMAQSFVEDRLISPSTAEYENCYDASITYLGNRTYEVLSYVDSQNGFGAMIRSDYYALLRDTGEDNYWVLVEEITISS